MSTSFPPATNATVDPSHDEITPWARELWTEAGQPEGRDDEFWFEGEQRLLVLRQVPKASAVRLTTPAPPVTRAHGAKNATLEKARRPC